MDKLETSVTETQNKASQVNDLKSKIQILEDGILEQENEIYLTSTKMIPPIVLSEQCTNLTAADLS